MPGSGKFLLDTNVVIGLLDDGIREAVETVSEVFLPVVAIGELYFGAAKSGRPEHNRKVIEQFVESRVVLACDLAVAREYGRVKSLLKTRGTPLPENDIWIGEIALRHELTLVSRDKHFLEIENLSLVSWSRT